LIIGVPELALILLILYGVYQQRKWFSVKNAGPLVYPADQYDERLGVLLASIVSGVLGFFIVYKVLGIREGKIHQEQ